MEKEKKIDVNKLSEKELIKLMPSLKRKKLGKIKDDVKRRYYYLCWYYTESQPLHLLRNYEKRCFRGASCYHLDHVVAISYGYFNNIPPEKIGSLTNLRFIRSTVNMRKGSKLTTESHRVLRKFKKK